MLRRDPWTPALGVLLVLTFAALVYLHRGTSFIYDDWNFWVRADELSPGYLLADYNGQACLVPKLLWNVTTAIFGGGDYLPFRLGAYAAHVAFLAGLFLVLRPRVGGAIAFAATVPLALMGTGSLTLVMVNTHHFFVLPLLWLVWAVVALDRGTRRGDVVACVLLVLSVFTSSSGVVPVAVAFAYLVWERPRLARLWVVAVPTALYLLWFAIRRPEQMGTTTRSDFALIPEYVVDGFTDGLIRYTALDGAFAIPLAIGLLLVLGALLAVRGPRLDRALVGFAFGGATFWALLALGRGPELRVGTGQYLYANALYAVATFVLLLTGLALLRERRVAVIALVLAGAFALPNVEEQVKVARENRQASEASLAASSAVNVLAAEDPAKAKAFNPVRAARNDVGFLPEPYVDEVVSGREPVGETTAGVAEQPERFRQRVDGFLATGLLREPAPARTPGGAPPTVQGADVDVRTDGACHEVAPAGAPTASITVAADRPVLVEATGGKPADVRVRRFADGFDPAAKPYAQIRRSGGVIDLPPVAGGAWAVNVAAFGPFRICGVA